MAYPLEKEHAEYQDYVISQNAKGEPALPREEWRKKRATGSNDSKDKQSSSGDAPVTTAMSAYS